jgi:hypothetical protein
MVEPDFFLICTPCSEQEREFAVSILVEVKYTAVLSIDSVAMGSAIAMDVNITKSTAVAIFLHISILSFLCYSKSITKVVFTPI